MIDNIRIMDFMLFTIVLIKPIRIVKLEILGLRPLIYILKNYVLN